MTTKTTCSSCGFVMGPCPRPGVDYKLRCPQCEFDKLADKRADEQYDKILEARQRRGISAP